MNAVKDLLGSLINFLKTAKNYWKTPPKGRYMPYKEILSLAFGGIGVRFIVTVITQMTISVGNTLIGNTIGIEPGPLYVIYIISLISAFPLTALRARMIDNSRSMKGKYRPYLVTMGIPTTLLGIGFIAMPYERMGMITKCVVVLLFNIGFQFFYNFYFDSYDSLINVLSPDSIERSDVLSVRSVIENLAPSVYNIAFPLVAKLITGKNTLYDMKVFRVLYPGMMIFGMLLSIMVYVNTEEKIVRAKTHFIEVKFIDAFRAVVRNKYFWIISLAGWLGFLESAFTNIMQWMYNYQHACTPGQYSIIVAIAGNASLWPNLVAPVLIRKYGKKNILVVSNLLNIVFIATMLPVVRQVGSPNIIWLLLFCNFINNFITSLGHLLTPGINADIRDYQQYISGERIDGMFAAVGLIGNIITMVTGLALPAIYSRSGLNKEVAISLGYDGSNVYDVLNNVGYFKSISSVLIIASVVGAAMNVIPYFFFDFTETKQKAVVRVLKIRAFFEDYGNNSLDPDSMKETLELIDKSAEMEGRTPHDLAAAKAKKSAARAGGRESFLAYKAELKRMRTENEEIEIADTVMAELRRFETEKGKRDLERAKAIAAMGVDAFLGADIPSKAQAKAMPKSTAAEKELRRETLDLIRDFRIAAKTRAKSFPNGVSVFDSAVFTRLFNEEDSLEERLLDASRRMKEAKENGRTDIVAQINRELTEIKKRKKALAKEIKEATTANTLYHRAAKPWLDAKKLVAQAENYSRLDEIRAGAEA